MLLEKLKQHGVKIMFFVMNLSVVASGVFFINQKKTEKATLAAAELDAQQYKSMVDYALNAQQLILSNKADKINSVVNNSGTVNRQQSVPVV
ncbi:MAG: hypothetical protein HGA36_03715, partial [Candidatus Moranbacteria bacterium]|nr:hypothetical protein [Candidatus Moranbacteria bacterium]